MVTPTLDEFRAEVRSFLDDAGPAAVEGRAGELAKAKAWRAALYDNGLAGLDYPVEHGGRDLGPEHLAIWAEESRGRIPREQSVFGIGVGMALPTVRDYGTDDLKERFIRPGLRGDELWCQMYSEPGSGSDLASLSTRAVRDGDEWGGDRPEGLDLGGPPQPVRHPPGPDRHRRPQASRHHHVHPPRRAGRGSRSGP